MTYPHRLSKTYIGQDLSGFDKNPSGRMQKKSVKHMQQTVPVKKALSALLYMKICYRQRRCKDNACLCCEGFIVYTIL